MNDDLYKKLISDDFFKPLQLRLNSDALNYPENNNEAMSKELRLLIFKTAQDYKDSLKETGNLMLEEAIKEGLSDNAVKLLVQIYFIGLQNGVTKYANSLIHAIETSGEILNE